MFEKQSVELVPSSIPDAESVLTGDELVDFFRDLPQSATYEYRGLVFELFHVDENLLFAAGAVLGGAIAGALATKLRRRASGPTLRVWFASPAGVDLYIEPRDHRSTKTMSYFVRTT